MRPRSLAMRKIFAQRRSTNEFYRKLLQRTFLKDSCCWEVGNLFFCCWTKKFHLHNKCLLNPNQELWRFQIFFPPKKGDRSKSPKSNESDQTFLKSASLGSHSATEFLYDFGVIQTTVTSRTKWLWKSIWFQKPTKAEITAGPYGVAGWQAEEEVLFRGGFPWGLPRSLQKPMVQNGGLVQMMIPLKKGLWIFFQRSCCWYFCELGWTCIFGWTFWTAKNWMVQRIQWISCTTKAGGLLQRGKWIMNGCHSQKIHWFH